MNLKLEIEKNNIPLNTLEDESLIQLFRELSIVKLSDKSMIREILKILMLRSKLFLLYSSTRSNSYSGV